MLLVCLSLLTCDFDSLMCYCKSKFYNCTVSFLRIVLCCSLAMAYRLYCDANYYSSDCSVHCVASDTDADGHYICDPITGNIACRTGRAISKLSRTAYCIEPKLLVQIQHFIS